MKDSNKTFISKICSVLILFFADVIVMKDTDLTNTGLFIEQLQTLMDSLTEENQALQKKVGNARRAIE